MDDQLLIDRLRADLRAERSAVAAPDWLADAGRSRWRRRRRRTRQVAGAALGVVLVAGAVTATAATVDGDDGPVETRRWATAPTTTTAPEGPSQTAEEAARDGVDPALAALPVSGRVVELAGTDGPPEGRYVISQPPGPGAAAEVLAIDTEGRIVRAFPMGGLAPEWLDVTSEEIFGGRFPEEPGAGRRPYGTVFRIDRRTLELTGVVFLGDHGVAAPLGRDGYMETTADDWRMAPTGTFLHELAFGGERPGWAQAVSTDERVWVDRNALRALFGLPPY